MAIIDRRKTGKNKSVGNRKKFIDRYKKNIKDSVDKLAKDKGITDVLKDREITIDDKTISEPTYRSDPNRGQRDIVLPGNKGLDRGDKIPRPPQGEGQGSQGSEDGEGEDDFTFTLTKEEFLDLYFSDMALPDFIKESMKDNVKYKWQRAGYVKDGIPSRLDLVKTLKQAMARRIATGSERYLDDVDMRYKHFVRKPFPIRQATMFLLMDVSGSMGEYEKMLAKKFFLLLYLFLHREYEKVDLIFIRHTQDAKIVTEEEFFYGKETGGTVVSSGLKLVNDTIDNDIDLSTTNVYVSQASDGDNWRGDDELCVDVLEEILTKVQYYSYIQTEDYRRYEMKLDIGVTDLYDVYASAAESHKNLSTARVFEPKDVFPVMRELFKAK